MTLSLVTVTGTFIDGSGNPHCGNITFSPSDDLIDVTGEHFITGTPVSTQMDENGQISVLLVATDNVQVFPNGWLYNVAVTIGRNTATFSTGLPSSPSTVDITALMPAGFTVMGPNGSSPVGATLVPYLPAAGGTLTGPLTLAGNPAAPLQATPKQYVDAETARAEGAEAALTAGIPSLPVSLTQGGTGATSAGAALTSLGAASASALTTETSRASAAEALLAPLASPALTGTPTAPTKTALTSNTDIATTAYADSAVAVETSRAGTAEALKAPLASPALTGTPTAPTQTTGDSTTKIATDAFVATAAAAAQAAAIAASLPTLTANVSVSASATLAVNTVTEASAGSNLTMTLPASVAGDVIVVEKSDSSTNTVGITGSIRGVGSSTLTLKLQSESIMFLGYAGSWWPVAGHKTLGSLDGRYGQIATANAWTASSTFKGPKPWFDLDAYGADPTGVSDSTAAFNSCVAAVLGGVYYTNLGYTASSATVTNPSAVAGDLNLYINSANFPAGYAQITNVNMGTSPPQYTMSANATASLSAQGAFVGYAQSQSIGLPLGRMRMGTGTYKVSSDLIIRSASGFFLEGQGPGATVIKASGAGFTQSVLFLDGHANGVFRNFSVSGDGTEGTSVSGAAGGVPDGVRLDYTTASKRSTTGNQFDNILVRNLLFVTGFSLEGTPSRQLDGTVCRNVIVTGQQAAGSWSSSGNWQAGIAVGNGTAGNVLDQVLYACGVNGCYYAYYNNNSSLAVFGAQPSSNAVDFYMVANGQCTIESVQSQSSGQFLVSPAAASSQPVSFRDCRFAGWTGTGYNSAWISIGTSRSNFTYDNLRYSAGSPPTPPVMNLGSGNNGASYSLSNIVVPAAPSAGIVPATGVPVVVVNYVDTTSGRVVYPFYAVNAGVLFQQGTFSARPSASTYGELFYWATDSVALYHSSGSAWTQVSPPATTTAPSVQWFNSAPGTYTWTKPSGAVTVFVLAVAGGGQGGSGAAGTSAAARTGGGGGGGGGVMSQQFAAPDLGSTVSAVIGAGGSAAGASVTGTSAGNNGSSGGNSSFGTYLAAFHGSGGTAGGAGTTGTGGIGGAGMAPGGAGGSGSSSGAVGVGSANSAGPAGGAGGGGLTITTQVASNGGQGSNPGLGSTANTGSAGIVDTTAPGAGASITVQGNVGCGAGGGASSITTNAQAGANAAGYGAGGGGGGAANSSFSSGAGGQGAQGYVLVISYFQ